MKLSDNLKKIRKENNLSQEQLAEKLGVSRQSVSKWEAGQSYPEMDKILMICKMFNYNIDELMNENVKKINSVDTKRSKIIKILSIVIIILLIFSSVMTYKYIKVERDYEDTVNGWNEEFLDGQYPNIYYATIKEIDDLDIYTTEVKITIEGWDYNDAIHRGEFYFQFSVSDIGDYIKVIDSYGKEVEFAQLREGQDVAVYQYGYLDDDDLSRLTHVRRIQILGDGTYEFEDDEEDSEVF